MSFVSIGDFIFPTLVAISEDEQIKGLMNVSWPPPVMSFIYSEPQINKFWMKNTVVPLDILFCHNGEIVSIKQGKPLSELPIGDDVVSDLVVELPRGSVEKFAINVGTQIKIDYNIKDLNRKFASKY